MSKTGSREKRKNFSEKMRKLKFRKLKLISEYRRQMDLKRIEELMIELRGGSK